jgi:hypothetical protein
LRHAIATGNLVYYLMNDPGAVIGPWDRAGIREGPDPMERVPREWIRAASIANGLEHAAESAGLGFMSYLTRSRCGPVVTI